MHPGAEYLAGKGFPHGWALDEGFDLGMQVGAHAMCRTPDGILNHTQNHTTDARYWYNGREMGEIGQGGLEFGHFDIPNVLVTGDAAACREATEFFGDHCVTVPVKFGYSRHCGRLLSPEKTSDLIRDGAREAVGRGDLVKPLKLSLPISAKVETLVEPAPDDMPLEEVYAAPHQSHEGVCETQLDIYRF
jgi:D-amino peptidase